MEILNFTLLANINVVQTNVASIELNQMQVSKYERLIMQLKDTTNTQFRRNELSSLF